MGCHEVEFSIEGIPDIGSGLNGLVQWQDIRAAIPAWHAPTAVISAVAKRERAQSFLLPLQVLKRISANLGKKGNIPRDSYQMVFAGQQAARNGGISTSTRYLDSNDAKYTQ